MSKNFTEETYELMLEELFNRFPSFQKDGAGAYKPGIANMEFVDQLMGHPHRNYMVIHVAGTNGKGSVCNMLASVLAAQGLKVGLYTSPHIMDFRERARVVTGDGDLPSYELISRQAVWDFVRKWRDTFDHLDMSFFEITTMMALDWFADQEVDYVVVETGLGGRLDSTNIVTPVLSVITNIGLDHCDMLGDTLPEIAFEKAGIVKPKVPVVIGESHPQTDEVFERKVLYTNLPEPDFMGNRTTIMSLLTFADKVEPSLWDSHGEILAQMDLQGEYQRKNLRTVLAALDVLSSRGLIAGTGIFPPSRAFGKQPGGLLQRTACGSGMKEALIHTAERTGFHGRWEKIMDCPQVICDIGHNGHGLKYNFAQLDGMKAEGKCSDLIIVYGSVADKDVDAAITLMPEDATYLFTRAKGKRALDENVILDKYRRFCTENGRTAPIATSYSDVADAVAQAVELAQRRQNEGCSPLVYIGGSTYVVSEAVAYIRSKNLA